MFKEIIRKIFGSGEEIKSAPHDGMTPISYAGNPLAYAYWKNLSYDNTYPAISKITREFSTIRPYAIDSNGKPVNQCRLIDKLYHPNKQMSAIDFREALAVMTLVFPKVYLLVWHYEKGKLVAGGPITPDNLAGFTFLEDCQPRMENNIKYYKDGKNVWTENDVIEIFSGVNPYNVSDGYAPTTAARKWASVDDYIAAYNAGLFENDAVPAGQFVITAPNPAVFESIVRKMQDAHRGAGRNNSVQYIHRPTDPTSGAPLAAQVEWIPFARANSEMALDTIFKQVNDKIDSAFGVPASIRGVNDNNTYASVRVDEQIFIRYTVKPLATKIYSRITHEMNRITGGLGYALTFDLNIPGVAEEEKLEAERKKTEFDLINAAVTAGYSLDSVVDAFDLSNGYKLLKEGYQKPIIVNDKPEVDDGSEVEDAPDSSSLKQVSVNSKVDLHESGCHCCKGVDDEPINEEIAKPLRELMVKQIETAIVALDEKAVEVIEDEDEEEEKTSTAVMAAVIAQMIESGDITYSTGRDFLSDHGVELGDIRDYNLSDAVKDAYYKDLLNTVRSYATDTNTRIENIKAEATTLGWDKEQLATKLREIVKTDEWRIQRIARTEEHRARNTASMDAMSQLSMQSGLQIEKCIMTVSAEPCEFCQSLANKWIPVDGNFVVKGDTINGVDGGVMLNNYMDIKAADIHPHCLCRLKYRFSGINDELMEKR